MITTSDTFLYSASVVLQVAAVVFCLLMAHSTKLRGAWIGMAAAMGFMLFFRVTGLLSSGPTPLIVVSLEHFRHMAATSSATISLLLFLSLFAIRRISLSREQATTALGEANQTSELRMAQLLAVVQSMTEGLFICDATGNVIMMNAAALAINEFSSQAEAMQKQREVPDLFELRELTGEIVAPEQLPLSAVLKGERFVERELRVRRGDTGRETILSYAGTPVLNADGCLTLAVLTFRDVTERRRSERALAESRQRLQSLFDTAQDAILLTDDSARFVDVNPAACELTGFSRDELLQQTVWDLTPVPNAEMGQTLWRQFIAAGRQSGEYAVIHRNGVSTTVEYRAVANILQGLHLSVLRDVTDRKRFEAALRETADRLSLALDAADLGDWEWDAATDLLTMSERAAQIFGVPNGQHVTREKMRELLHADDRDMARNAAKRAVDCREDYDVEYRVMRPDGKLIWVAARGRGVLDVPGESGKIVRMLGVVQDITQRKLVEQERETLLASERDARSEAERTSRMKDEFLATLSHELRTPLNAILGWVQILRSGPPDAEDLSQGLETIERNARAQTSIIEDLLDMSRIISGKVRLDVQRVDLASVVAAAVETVRHAAQAKGVKLDSSLDPRGGPVAGDSSRLQQVFWNLLSNAVKFSSRGGEVRVVLERAQSHLEVRVIDNGEGIKPDFLPHVFDRFRQADASTTRRHGGLGLGLSIVKQLVELHGGSVQAASPGVGQGATFTVTLPTSPTYAGPLRNADESDYPGRKVSDSGQSNVTLAGINVLVVDDEPDARALVRRLLEDCDATVVTAGSAAEALERFSEEVPDVLVSDIGMPGEDGHELVRKIRSLGKDHGGNIPAIALTAYARSEDRTSAILAGFQLHLAKPVEPTELIAMIASLAARSENRP